MASRRRYLQGLAAGTFALSGCLDRITGTESELGSQTPTPTPTGEEPSDVTPRAQFQNDAANTGVSDGHVPEEAETRWRTTVSPITDGGLSVSDGRVLVTTSTSCYALDADAGEKLWDVRVGATEGPAPAVSPDTAYVTSLIGGPGDNGVVAIDLANGRTRWRAISDVYVRGTPTLEGGRVYVGGMEYGDEPTRTEVISIDATTGEERWRTPIDQEYSEDAMAVPNVTPAIESDTVFVDSGKEPLVYALDAEDGVELWRFEAASRIRAGPTVVDDTVYVGSTSGQVYALDANDGTELWSLSVDSEIRESVAATDDAVYVPGDSSITALTADGRERWSVEVTNRALAPTITEDAIVVTEEGGDAFCLDPVDGTERWRHEVRSRSGNGVLYTGIGCASVVGDDTVYVGSQGGDIYALDREGESGY